MTLVALTCFSGTTAQAQVINFDDINVVEFSGMPIGYGGLTWSTDWFVYSDTYYMANYNN